MSRLSNLLSICFLLTLVPLHSYGNGRTKRQTELLDNFCVQRPDGQIYPDPEDCKSYIFCNAGFAYKSACAPGLFYDPRVQTCDFDKGQCQGPSGRRNDLPPVPTSGYNSNYDYVSSFDDRAPTRPRDSSPPNPSLIDSGEYCKNNRDGTYPHPYDCHSYILCSNQVSFSTKCPDNLIYNDGTGGCDFDIDGLCVLRATKNSLSRNGDTANALPQLNSLDIKIDGNMPEALLTMMPTAIENALNALTEKLQEESDLSKLQIGDTDGTSRRRKTGPFRFVQKFLQATPMAKELSYPAFILEQATKLLIDTLGLEIDAETMRVLSSLISPLPPSIHRLEAGEEFPQPEPGTCPWPSYNCRMEKYRSFDGSCNNLKNPIYGRAFTALERFLPPDYGDGMQSIRQSASGQELPSPRRVSYTINEDRDSPHHMNTLMLMQWGQFLDHDLSHTAISKISDDPSGFGATSDIECGESGCEITNPACFPIHLRDDDPAFSGKECLMFVRSQETPNLNCTMGPREQLNQISSYLDGSNVYGSDNKEATGLRDTDHPSLGRMKMTAHPFSSRHKSLLPQTSENKECKEFDEGLQCFSAGDNRVNEQNMLTVMHTIWVREHNRIADSLRGVNPHWDGDTIYQETRRIVSAMLQHITYNEFLPVALGPVEMKKQGLELLLSGYYEDYDDDINAGIGNVFATAAFRFGHTLIPKNFRTISSDYKTKFQDLQLSDLFFRPKRLYNTDKGGIDGFLRGLCDAKIQNFDRFVTNAVTEHLFSDDPPNGIGTDLVSLNVMRGRDHGIPGYNAWREWCGLGKAQTFEDFVEIRDPEVRAKLAELYDHVDDVDLFGAGLAEDRSPGGLVGPTFACILGRQFHRSRSGDRFWYENSGAYSFTEAQLANLRETTLAKVMCNNGDNITTIQPHVMELPFREAFPKQEYNEDQALGQGLNLEWFNRLWITDYNRRVDCTCLPDLDLTLWESSP